jgi:hypothetical protein
MSFELMGFLFLNLFVAPSAAQALQVALPGTSNQPTTPAS